MNPLNLVSSALNYLNPNMQGNIWNTPGMRAIRQPLVKTQQGIVNTVGQGVDRLLPYANTIGKFIGRQPLFNIPQSPTYLQGARTFSNFQGANPNQPTALTAALSGNVEQIPGLVENTAGIENKNIFTPQGSIAGIGAVDAGGTIVKSAAKQVADEVLSRGSAAAKEGINRLDAIVSQNPELQSFGQRADTLQPGTPIRGEPVFTAPAAPEMPKGEDLARKANPDYSVVVKAAKSGLKSLNPQERATYGKLNFNQIRQARGTMDLNSGVMQETGQMLHGKPELALFDEAIRNKNWDVAIRQAQGMIDNPAYADYRQGAKSMLQLAQNAKAKEAAVSPLEQGIAATNKAAISSAKGESPLSLFEKSAANNRNESIAYFDKNGNKVYQSEPGGKQTAKIPVGQNLQNAVVSSHNHQLAEPNNPASELNQVAVAPDKYDMAKALQGGIKEVRTTSPAGTISVKFPDNLDQTTIENAFRNAATEGTNAYRAALARGENPYYANVARVKAENDAVVKGLGAKVSRTGEVTKGGGETPVQKAATFLKSPEAQSGKINFFSQIGKIFGKKAELPQSLSGTGQGIEKPRGFVQTVQESPQAPQRLKDLVSGTYNVKANTDLINAANTRIAKDPIGATQFAMKENSDESTATAIQLVKKLSGEGNHQAAADIVNHKAEQLTEAGRTIQAASLFDNLSPEGVGQLAARTIQRYNIAARQKIPELTASDLKAVQDMAAKIKTMPDGSRAQDMARQRLLQTVARLVPSGPIAKGLGIWRAGLLTGPQTVTKIVTSHAAMLALEQLKNLPAKAVDSVISLFSKQKGLSLTGRGIISGGKQGINDAVDNLFHGYEAPNSGGFARDFKNTLNYSNSFFGKVAQQYVDTVGRLHGSLYKPFYGSAHMNSLYDQAFTTAANQKLTGTARDNFILNFMKDPTPDAMKIAGRDAAYATFQQRTMLGNVASAAQRGLGPAGKIIAPFTRIPSAILTDAVDYTPVGIAKSVIQAVNRGQFTQDSQRQLSQGIGRGITGTSLIAIGAALFNQGMISLDRPQTGRAAAQWDLEGRKPQSVKIDGQWKNLASLGPMGHVLGIGGYFQQGLANSGFNEAIGSAALGLGRITLSQPYLMQISNLEQAVTSPQQKALQLEKSLASSVVPTLSGTIARAIDPLQRQTNTVGEAVQTKVPFFRQNLLPKTSIFGKSLERSGGIMQNLFDPFQSYTDTSGAATNDPLTTELGRLNDAGFPATPVKLGVNQTLHGVKAKLTPEQLNTLNQTMGPQVQNVLNKIIQSSEYRHMSDEEKSATISKAVAKVHTSVRNTYNESNPSSPLQKYVKPGVAKVRSKGLFNAPKLSKSGLFRTHQTL